MSPMKPSRDKHAVPADDYVEGKKTKQKPRGAAAMGPGPGRPKGVPNKVTTQLKEAILEAGERAGGPEGLVGYLTNLASENSSAFASLLGKVLPTTLAGDQTNPIEQVHRIVREVVDPKTSWQAEVFGEVVSTIGPKVVS